jgi:hypothetical protein
MVLDLREEGGQDLGLAFRPARWDELPAAEVISIHELLPSGLFFAQNIRARRLNAAVRRERQLSLVLVTSQRPSLDVLSLPAAWQPIITP